MDLSELKKLGNKIYSLSVKIEESNKNGMKTRIPGYVEKLSECSKKAEKLIQNLENEY